MNAIADLHLICHGQTVPSIIFGAGLEPFGMLVWHICALEERHAPLALEYKAINIYYLVVCKPCQHVSMRAECVHSHTERKGIVKAPGTSSGPVQSPFVTLTTTSVLPSTCVHAILQDGTQLSRKQHGPFSSRVQA